MRNIYNGLKSEVKYICECSLDIIRFSLVVIQKCLVSKNLALNFMRSVGSQNTGGKFLPLQIILFYVGRSGSVFDREQLDMIQEGILSCLNLETMFGGSVKLFDDTIFID